MNVSTDDSDRQNILRRALVEIREMRTQLAAAEKWQREPVAIVGVGCRFPGGAHGPEAFWQLLSQGVDAITDVPPERWDIDAWFDADPSTPGKMYTRSGGFLAADVGGFDPGFFHISPREVTTMDPQQRMLLEVAWEALEHAAQPPQRVVGGDVGVFVGISTNDYAQLAMFADPAKIELYTATGNALNAAAGRLSYVFGFQGPAMAVDTACSSSLVTVHLACQSLRNRECRLALAGGVSLILAPDGTLATCRARMMAPDGRCKTFDASADGYVRGEGCGLVVLKCLSDAIADGDRILAVIRGSAVNQDGASGGLTVPNGVAQRALIGKALANAGVEPAAVSCIEAHGTGTPLGDPIEVEALQAVYAAGRPPDRPLIVGSVKTNIGHLEAAAGVAGLIKVVLAMQHGEIPPHLHFKALNPHIQLDPGVVIPTTLHPWPRSDFARLAAVSSFGFTGTNAHVIVEEAPASARAERDAGIDRPLHLVTLSGRSADALSELAGRYRDHVPAHPDQDLGDIAFTANAGRSHFVHRTALVAATREELMARLAEAGTAGAGVLRGQAGERPRVAFLFTGQGSQYAGMGRGLYQTQPVFRAALDHCAELLRPYLQAPLAALLYEPGHAPDALDQTGVTQPALFALEYALARLWQSWGIEPAVVLGHSVGEYVAACIAGVFTVEEALALVARRAQLMQALPLGGAMAAVWADEAQVAAALAHPALADRGSDVSIAAVNGPSHVVIAGAGSAVAAVCEVLQQQGVRTQALRVSHAFHSALMQPMLAEFAEAAAGVAYRSPQLRLISNVSGKLIEGGTTLNADYWVRHVRETVRFHDGLKTLQEQGCRLVLEIGPQPTLLALGQECAGAENATWLASLRRGRDDWAQMLDSLARLYVNGCQIDWDGFDRPYRRQRIALPTYPFQRKKYWAAPTASKPSWSTAVSGSASHPYLGHRVQSPLQQIQFEAAFSLRTLPLVGDHRILGMPWLNLVLYLEMAAAAAVECHGAGPIVLKDVAVPRPLILRDDESRPVHLVLSVAKEGAAAFEIHSLSTTREGQSAGNGSWLLHAQGEVTVAGKGEPAAADPMRLDDARARCTDEISRKEFYAAMEQHGVSLGPACRWLDRLWRGEGEALGRIRAERPNELDRRYVLNLGAIDACFQLLGALLPPGSPSDYVLSGLERFCCWPQDKPLDLWARAVLVAHDEAAGTLTAHVSVFDQTGRIVAAIDNARLQRVGLAAVGPQTQYRGEPIKIVRGPQLSIDDLLAAPPERAPELLVAYLTAMLAQSLGVAVSDINGDTPLAVQIDSLVAVEMKTQIERDLELAVPVAAFFDGNSIRELAGTLCAELKTFAAAASGDEMEDLLGEIERMSDDEAQARAAAQRQTDRRHVAHE